MGITMPEMGFGFSAYYGSRGQGPWLEFQIERLKCRAFIKVTSPKLD
jgi:hypothetical protein